MHKGWTFAGLVMLVGGLFVIYTANFDLPITADREAPFVLGWAGFICIYFPGLVCLGIARLVGWPTPANP